jgi:CobQ-like glutamine amidotransferase family enzyme
MNRVLQLFPEVLDVNGDAQNALVLAQRATWAGLPATVVPVGLAEPVAAADPVLVVIGSSVDSALPDLRVAIDRWEPRIRDWLAAGIPILAVGTGMELLGGDGIGLLPGHATARAERATGDLAVASEFGMLIGFENHARGFQLPSGARALGTVVRGVGNDGRSEGVRSGSVWGTHLHGPVLAKNPTFADALLTAAFGDRYSADDERIRGVDRLADAARRAIADRIGIASTP